MEERLKDLLAKLLGIQEPLFIDPRGYEQAALDYWQKNKLLQAIFLHGLFKLNSGEYSFHIDNRMLAKIMGVPENTQIFDVLYILVLGMPIKLSKIDATKTWLLPQLKIEENQLRGFQEPGCEIDFFRRLHEFLGEEINNNLATTNQNKIM